MIVAARLAGKSGQPVIFVHGVGSTAAIWDYQLSGLSDKYRCAAIELRGNGAGADVEPERITREGFRDDVLAVADALGFETFHFVGCSLGGVVAFELWKAAQMRVKSLVFVGSFAAYPNADAYAQGIVDAVNRAGDMKRFAMERAMKLGLPPHRFEETVQQMACKRVPSYIASTRATWTGDYRGMLSSIDIPTLVVYGENDAIAPRELSEEIARGIPSSRLERIANAGHVTNADAPDQLNALLRAFLETV
ncbi:MAG: alpha/beta fold hydrolase [Candidatus Eremiobacteraeota bacterium]|nr:alpha/beta fold hydrolase [Candidatus Eremiobacteraeota bacterium]